MAIYLEPGGPAVCQVVIPCMVIPCTRTSENAGRANFLELRQGEVCRIPLPRTPLNSASPQSRRAQQARGLNTSGAYSSGGEADGLGESLRWWPGAMPHSCKPARRQPGERTEG